MSDYQDLICSVYSAAMSIVVELFVIHATWT